MKAHCFHIATFIIKNTKNYGNNLKAFPKIPEIFISRKILSVTLPIGNRSTQCHQITFPPHIYLPQGESSTRLTRMSSPPTSSQWQRRSSILCCLTNCSTWSTLHRKLRSCSYALKPWMKKMQGR